MTIRRPVLILSLLCLLAAAGAAALLLVNRRDVTTSSAAAYQAYQRGFENENRFYKKEARVDYARAIQLDPEFAEAILGLARQADRDQAISLVERAWTLRDRLTERERLHVDIQRAGLNRQRDEVLALAKALHEKYPRDIMGVQALAGIEGEQGHTERALELFKELLKIDPNYALAYNNIGYSYGYSGDYEKAIENFQKYQFMAPDQANPLDSMGEIQAYSGHYDEAIASLQKALAIKPDFYPAYEHLGVAYEGKGDYARSIESYEKAADLDVTNDMKEIDLLRALRVALFAKNEAAGEKISKALESLPGSRTPSSGGSSCPRSATCSRSATRRSSGDSTNSGPSFSPTFPKPTKARESSRTTRASTFCWPRPSWDWEKRVKRSLFWRRW